MRAFSATDSVQHLVGTLFRRIARVSTKAVKGFEISAVQANVLVALWHGGPMTIGELQSLLALKSSTLTGAVDRMEAAGLVSRREVPEDRRAWRLVPVSWPARKQRALLEAIVANEEAALEDLTAAERRELVRLLKKANDSLARVEEEG